MIIIFKFIKKILNLKSNVQREKNRKTFKWIFKKVSRFVTKIKDKQNGNQLVICWWIKKKNHWENERGN